MEKMRYLLEQPEVDFDGDHLLDLALEYGSPDMVRFLVNERGVPLPAESIYLVAESFAHDDDRVRVLKLRLLVTEYKFDLHHIPSNLTRTRTWT